MRYSQPTIDTLNAALADGITAYDLAILSGRRRAAAQAQARELVNEGLLSTIIVGSDRRPVLKYLVTDRGRKYLLENPARQAGQAARKPQVQPQRTGNNPFDWRNYSQVSCAG